LRRIAKSELTIFLYYRIHGSVKTTIEIPDALVERTKIAAARRRSTMRSLVIEGLERILEEQPENVAPVAALQRLRKGYRLGGKPLTREEAHAR
jgi:predicted DNA-binding protein